MTPTKLAFSASVAAALLALSCATTRPPPVARNVTLDALETVAGWPDAEDITVMTLAQQFMAAHRYRRGYDWFHARAAAQPSRPLLVSLEGLFQALMSDEIPLLSRVGWVEDAIKKLDRGAAAEPRWGRYLRGLTFAELPDRFGKARQAIDDLKASLAAPPALVFDPQRGIYRALGLAYATAGDKAASKAWLERAGTDPGSPDDARLLGGLSVTAADGFRFASPSLETVAPGVYSAEGFDFGSMGFIDTGTSLIAIDAGSKNENAARALAAARAVQPGPVKALVLTHSHWDHVGGIDAVRGQDTQVLAQSRFVEGLRLRADRSPPGHWFLGSSAQKRAQIRIDRAIDRETEVTIDGRALRLVPLPPSETEDALLVFDVESGVAFVGDAFQPYVGSPTSPEGSSPGLLQTIRTVLALKPRKLVHGHTPLTRLFTLEALPGLLDALTQVNEQASRDLREGRPLAEAIGRNVVPEALKSSPQAALPFVLIRDHFIQRLYAAESGYWQRDGEGVEVIADRDWAAALDLMAGGSEESFTSAVERLLSSGDWALALRLSDLGLLRHPSSAKLRAGRTAALTRLREQASSVDPFRFILYSEIQGAPTRPVLP